ncbi:UDP-3-O-(3-hydroxymyristoyl)glucosamine N-acyltransferase [Marimonas arenosa]|uniref:UDP-3-O-acylglucosamine N-acyltransferase n=1 Tax=Marimonas arenosa TaxID=1795305 RepID=A0AAE4B5I1_9RHOB|nr:UDP-3-O-(3-hydroxymyristoyl)glucosamine N-acyltransferase [Marimonas arenosa]MDQ2091370.1 UDP-3-O-(3-hydroxymyristoyl)glucosamine N-acyltransferase [Marimonas arenosa]
MSYTIEQIADQLGVPAEGDVSIRIERAAEPSEAGTDALALAMHPKYSDKLECSAARAAILWEGADWRGLGLEAAIFFPRPRFAMAAITQLMDEGPDIAPGVHPSADIDPTADIGSGAAIGPYVVIGKRALIGRNARIAAHAVIGADAHVGDDALILEGAKIGARVHAGDRLLVKPGAVIGADGFSFVTPEKSTVESVRETLDSRFEARAQSLVRIHSLGSVRIGDDVEIGANSTIDRGTVQDTTIGSGTKIDNQVQIGHNVTIGNDCLLCGHSGVAGSSFLGDRVVVGGAASIADHLSVGNDAVIAGKSGVASNVPAGRAMMGYPAMPLDRNVEAYKALRRLPRLIKTIAELKSSLRSMEKRN